VFASVVAFLRLQDSQHARNVAQVRTWRCLRFASLVSLSDTFSLSGSTACGVCSSGYLGNSRSGTCVACDVGRFSSNPGSAFCQDCAAGTYANLGQSSCTRCPAGQSSLTSSSTCFSCQPGRFAATVGSSACDLCASGKRSSFVCGKLICFFLLRGFQAVFP
jgi:hypothetical protein